MGPKSGVTLFICMSSPFISSPCNMPGHSIVPLKLKGGKKKIYIYIYVYIYIYIKLILHHMDKKKSTQICLT